MEFVFEIIVDAAFDFISDIILNKKVSGLVRIPLATLLVLFYVCFIGFIVCLGIFFSKKNTIVGFAITLFGVILICLGIMKLYKVFINE